LANGIDDNVRRVLAQGCWTPVETFGLSSGWAASAPDEQGGFEVAWQGKPVGRLSWGMVGAYNRMNALAAIGAAHHAGIEPSEAMAALSRFGGVKRRLELRGTARGVLVYDDFAHHPTAIRETIAGLRQRHPAGRILAVFEPRSNTLKQGVLKEALPASFGGADRIFIHSVGLSWDAPAVFAPLGPRVHCVEELSKLVAAIVAEAQDGDHVLVMSNGGFGGIHQKLLAAL
jgi:UDP-N-acetylmuramate: L-alanyl-gamma-D-glutamyl-meso-diaminopimelate ligase